MKKVLDERDECLMQEAREVDAEVNKERREKDFAKAYFRGVLKTFSDEITKTRGAR